MKADRPETVKWRGEDPVREVLLERGLWEVNTISPRASVLEALSRMEERNIGALIVTDKEGVAGVLSERDCARKVVLQGYDPANSTVSSVMSRWICSVTANKRVSECIELMLRRHVRHLPVLFGRYLVGCVSLRNLMEYLFQVRPESGVEGPGWESRQAEEKT